MRICYGPSQKIVLAGFSIDLSTGGLYLKTDFPLERDEELILHFTLAEEDKTISCKARVAWVNTKQDCSNPELPAGAGLQFVDISLDALQAIRRFLVYNEIKPKW